MRSNALRHGFWAVVAGCLFLPASLLAQETLSHARIVRLSYVSGTVALKQPGSTEPVQALVNMPIQEGFELSTGADSFAEVEFENGSTARLGELSKVDFSQLALDTESEQRLSSLTFEQGYATFHFMPEHHEPYSVKIADATLTPSGKGEFRADVQEGRIRVEVFEGTLEVVAPFGSAKVGKDKALEYEPGAEAEAFTVRPRGAEDSWDKWTEARDTQEQLALKDQAVKADESVYGWSDLDAYGEWAFFPGFGYGWAPYVPVGWAPFSMGLWGFYPGLGMTWISTEPWGWLPYHCGWWNFDPIFGWYWMPFGCNSWWPGLVTWYRGNGWIGWRPRPNPGPGRPVIPRHLGLKSVTTVPVSVVQNGQMITPDVATHVRPADGTKVTPEVAAQVQPSSLAGVRLTPDMEVALHAPSSRASAGGAPAPATIMMGGDAAAEEALPETHPGGWGKIIGRSQPQPLRVRAGLTLGGQYPVAGNVGEFRGEASQGVGGTAEGKGKNGPKGSASGRRSSRSGPVVLAHGKSAAASYAGGAVRASGGGGVRAGGGGSSSSGRSAGASMSSSAHSTSSGGGSVHH